MTELQKKYQDKGLVVVGVTNEQKDIVKVRKYVEEMGEKMQYVVAVDEQSTTYDAYMKPFGIRGIPHSFIVDKTGAILWHDHPMLIGDVLDKIMAGTFDLPAAKKLMAQREEEEKLLRKAGELMTKYFELVSAGGNPDEAKRVAEEVLKLVGKNADALNAFAWNLLTKEDIKHRDLDLAMRVAQAAYDACEGKNAAIVDTYARALFDTGKVEDAIKHQKKAVELCDDPELLKDLKESLERYEKKARGEQ